MTTPSSDRRDVLKGLMAAGLLVSTPSWARSLWATGDAPTAAGAPALAVSTLVSGSALDSAFLAGVNSALPGHGATATHQLSQLDAGLYQQLNAQLNDGEPGLLVALLDDASAVLVLDLLRSAGAQVLSVQHHQVAQGSDAAAWAQALGQSLMSDSPLPQARQATPATGTLTCVSLRCVI